MAKTWFITGTSRGFGREWAIAALERGDKVAAALAQEVADLGIHVTLIEPGGFETDWFGSSAAHANPLPAYDEVRQHAAESQAHRAAARGNPEATREAILTVVDAPQPPLRIFFGDGPLATATAEYQSRLDTWRKWEPVSIAAQGRTA